MSRIKDRNYLDPPEADKEATLTEGYFEPNISGDITLQDPSEMTDEVKNAVIRHFQKSLASYQDRYEYMEHNAESAYAQTRALRDAHEQLIKETSVKISLLKQNINTLYQNSLMIKIGE